MQSQKMRDILGEKSLLHLRELGDIVNKIKDMAESLEAGDRQRPFTDIPGLSLRTLLSSADPGTPDFKPLRTNFHEVNEWHKEVKRLAVMQNDVLATEARIRRLEHILK
jgi:hypothetical protein